MTGFNWFLMAVSIGITSLTASSFLVKEKTVSKNSLKQIRNKTIVQTGDLIKQVCKEIERLAQLQGLLCTEFKKAMEGSKDSQFLKMSSLELQKLLQEVQVKFASSKKEQVACEQLIAQLNK